MGVGCHQVQPLEGLCSQRYVSTPTVTLAGVLEHEGLRTSTESCGEDRTVVDAIEARETANRRNGPVADAVVVDLLVEDTLDSSREGE